MTATSGRGIRERDTVFAANARIGACPMYQTGSPALPRAFEEVVTFFASGPSRDMIAAFRLSDTAIDRVRDLLTRGSLGTLTEDEADELDQCVQLDRLVTLIRS